jgi:hypothetical protein
MCDRIFFTSRDHMREASGLCRRVSEHDSWPTLLSSSTGITHTRTKPRMQWVLDWAAQLVLASAQYCWCLEVEVALNTKGNAEVF